MPDWRAFGECLSSHALPSALTAPWFTVLAALTAHGFDGARLSRLSRLTAFTAPQLMALTAHGSHGARLLRLTAHGSHSQGTILDGFGD